MESGYGVRKEPLSPLGKKGRFSWKKHAKAGLKAFLAVLIAFLLSVGSQILYWRYAYGTFLVNGSSMYPTLNHDAEMWVDGKLSDIPSADIGAFDGGAGTEYVCDFGLMDDSPDFRDSLERFSVVITYFDDDFRNGDLLSGAAPKIKRIVGLPGETIQIDDSGSLFVDGEEVPQDFVPEWGEEYFQDHLHETGAVAPITLGEDEYFLLGDNRAKGASDDSRIEGPISSSSLVGRAVAVLGRSVYRAYDGSTSFRSYRWPWEVMFL